MLCTSLPIAEIPKVLPRPNLHSFEIKREQLTWNMNTRLNANTRIQLMTLFLDAESFQNLQIFFLPVLLGNKILSLFLSSD